MPYMEIETMKFKPLFMLLAIISSTVNAEPFFNKYELSQDMYQNCIKNEKILIVTTKVKVPITRLCTCIKVDFINQFPDTLESRLNSGEISFEQFQEKIGEVARKVAKNCVVQYLLIKK